MSSISGGAVTRISSALAGVLRLLSLVIGALKEEQIPYISLGDFDLSRSGNSTGIVKAHWARVRQHHIRRHYR